MSWRLVEKKEESKTDPRPSARLCSRVQYNGHTLAHSGRNYDPQCPHARVFYVPTFHAQASEELL